MAALAGAVLLLVAVEVAIRLLGVAPPKPKAYQDTIYISDPWLPYRQRPLISRDERASSGEFREVFQHSSAGFRDVEHSLAKSNGTFRILGLGGSIAYGSGVRFEESFFAVLEAELNWRGGGQAPVEVIKAGVGGFFPRAERLLLEHYGMAFSPDLAIVAFDPDDLLESYLGIDEFKIRDGFLKTSEARELGVVRTFLAVHTHVGRILFRRWSSRRHARQLERFRGHEDEAWQLVFGEFEAMKKILESAGGRLLVCFIPLRLDAGDPAPSRLRDFCARQGIGFVDTTPALAAAAARGDVYWKRDRHCTALGHRAIADALLGSGLVK